MDFYEELSRYYDEIFPAEAGDFSFFKDLFGQRKNMLDIGCGTGNKTIHFKDSFEKITAFDLDSGMIEEARKKHSAPNIEYKVMGMEDLSPLAGEAFDTILCLGNSLVHLDSLANIKIFFKELKKISTPEAVLLVQILNYDKIIAEKLSELPLIDTPNLSFFRSYAWNQGELHFVTTLYLKNEDESLQNDVILLPLLQKDLTASIVEAGFAEPVYYGNYKGAPHSPDSLPSIAFSKNN